MEDCQRLGAFFIEEISTFCVVFRGNHNKLARFVSFFGVFLKDRTFWEGS